jgi:hypothetical protein
MKMIDQEIDDARITTVGVEWCVTTTIVLHADAAFHRDRHDRGCWHRYQPKQSRSVCVSHPDAAASTEARVHMDARSAFHWYVRLPQLIHNLTESVDD